MTADELLAAIGKMAGLDRLALDDEGVCQLVFDGTTAVDVERSPDGGALHLHSALGPVPSGAGFTFYSMLLAANYFGGQTGGNVLAVLPVEGTVFLCRTAPLEGVDPEEFALMLGEFVRQVRKWTERVHAAPVAAGKPLGDRPAPGQGPMMRV